MEGAWDAVIAKLSRFAALSPADIEALRAACSATTRIRPGAVIHAEGSKPEHAVAVIDGWAIRYKLLEDGARQILAFIIPGDVCDLAPSGVGQMDHDIRSLTPLTHARIPHLVLNNIMKERPAIMRAFLGAQMADEAVLRAWLTNLGRRDAYQRLAHLFCELWMRCESAGLASGGEISMPMSQVDLADAMGLTSVHVNRTMRCLREKRLIRYKRGLVEIVDASGLIQAAGFDPAYLQPPRATASPMTCFRTEPPSRPTLRL